MSTPPTPAGWYPDPDGSGGQRYWDGAAWTAHSSPGEATPELPAEQPTVVVPTRPAPAEERVGAHRKPEPDLEPADFESVEPEPGPTAPVAQWTPPPFEPAYEPQAFTAPLDGPSAPGDNRKKLIVRFSVACAGLLAVLVLVLVYALFIHDPGTVQGASPTTATPAETTADEPTSPPSETQAPSATQAPVGGESVDGALSFTVHGFDVVPTVASSDAPVEKTAQGEFVVVRLTVTNTGDAPTPFLGNYQRLNAAGITYYPDDEATFDVGGGVAELNPGDAVDVAVAFDVPPGTVPESIELHGGQMSPGVQLPL